MGGEQIQRELFQTFTLHPTYYIDPGNSVQGQKPEYTGGDTALTATLNPDDIRPLRACDSPGLAEVFATWVPVTGRLMTDPRLRAGLK